MTALFVILFAFAAATGAGIVLSREPRRQAIAIGVNGLVLALLFLALQAPDVAYSELVIGAAALPLLFMVALAILRRGRHPR